MTEENLFANDFGLKNCDLFRQTDRPCLKRLKENFSLKQKYQFFVFE